MARAFKFFAAFFLTALIVFGGIFGLNYNSIVTFFENRHAMVEGSEWVEETYSLRGLTHYIGENPEHVSIASMVVDSPDSTLFFQENQPRPMGTITNLFILIASADLINNGTFDADEPLEWTDISRYQIPEVHVSEHKQSRDAAREREWLSDETISLQNALHLLAEYNDLALADYLWWKIGPDRWKVFEEKIELTTTDMPLPFSGLYISISSGLSETGSDNLPAEKPDSTTQQYHDDVINYSRRYSNDLDFREKVSNYADGNRLGITFMEERDALALFPKTTAKEMVQILKDVWNDELFEPSVSRQVKEWMRWPTEQQSDIMRDFSDYGAIYDNRMGLLNGIDFGISAYTGDTTVQAVFFDRLQIAFWFHMSSNHMHQDFQQRLIYDPALIDQMKNVVEMKQTQVNADPS